MLSDRFGPSTFNPLVAADLLRDEIQQRRETGYSVDVVVERANRLGPDDRTELLDLVDELADCRRTEDWRYVEPEGLDAITESLPDRPAHRPVDPEVLFDRIHAAWLGRIAGCNLGKPVEMGDHWTPEHIRAYLELADAYPLQDYFPVLDPMPVDFHLNKSWPATTRGRVNGSARDDDIDYTILGLHLLEQHGRGLEPQHVAAEWLRLLPVLQTFTAERAVYVNLVNGLAPPRTASYRNPYREWIGAQIRGDIYGYVYPGDPWSAAALAFQDASLSHVANGVYGEMWAAALVASAFVSSDATEALSTAVRVVPPGSRLAEAVRFVLDLHSSGVSWDEGLTAVRERFAHYSWVHTVNNAALVAAGLLWGKGDYLTSVAGTVMGGWDTDSNGATVGSVAGVLTGTVGLAEHLVAPLQDRTRSALFGWDGIRISQLAERTHQLASHGSG